MSTLLIEGGQRLSGAVDVEGNKNAALPLLAACLLTTDECVLTNVPRISDVEVMARLLLDLGAEVEGIGSTSLRVRCAEVVKDEPDAALVGRLRGSVCSARRSRGVAGRALRRRAAISRAPHDRDASRGATAMGPRSTARDTDSRRSRAPARVNYLRSLGHGHWRRCRRGCREWTHRDSPPPAARRRGTLRLSS